MIYLKPTNRPIGRTSVDKTPLWIYLVVLAEFLIAIYI